MTFKERAKLAKEQLSKQPPVTFKQAKAQTEKHMEKAKESFAKQAPAMQEYARQLTTPLEGSDMRFIYRWLFRKQITIEMLPKSVLKEFKQTELYSKFIKIKE